MKHIFQCLPITKRTSNRFLWSWDFWYPDNSTSSCIVSSCSIAEGSILGHKLLLSVLRIHHRLIQGWFFDDLDPKPSSVTPTPQRFSIHFPPSWRSWAMFYKAPQLHLFYFRTSLTIIYYSHYSPILYNPYDLYRIPKNPVFIPIKFNKLWMSTQRRYPHGFPGSCLAKGSKGHGFGTRACACCPSAPGLSVCHGGQRS